ncbi:MAG: ABC transporter permease [Anaerolineae bacterium]|nr:ABC transporter permease [Phycisphaerae bacterium]
MLLRKLAISNFAVRKARVVLTIAAIAMSVSLVVAVTTGYASVEAAARKFLGQYLGAWDAQITRPTDPKPGVDVAWIDQLRADPAVRRAVGRLESDIAMLNKDGKPAEGGRHASVFGIDRSSDDSTDRLKLNAGRWFTADELNGVVIDEGTQRNTQVKVGDTLLLPGTNEKLPLKVTGIIHKPGILVGYINSMYLPLPTLQKFLFDGRTDRVSKIQIEFNENINAEAFMQRWQTKLQQADPLLKLRLTRERRDQLDQNLMAVHVLSYLGGTVSMLAATFIVFSTVSMGVTERQRSLAMLRAVGLLRSQLVKLVLMEGALLGLLGALVGVPIGLFWVHVLAWKFADLFSAGVVASFGGIAFASLGSIGAAIIASILPAISAARVDPLEAMSPLANAGVKTMRPPIALTLVGLLLISIDPAIAFLGVPAVPGPVERSVRFYSHFVIGLPALMIGFFLLAPLFVWLVDRLFSRFAAMLFGVRYALLRQQLSGGLWRAAGTCAALMVGLSVLIVMQTQGHSALSSWELPDRFPDVFVYTTSRAGLDPAAQEKIRNTSGIKKDETMPIAMLSPEFGGGLVGLAGAAFMPNATMYFGIDPDKAFDMMHLDFRQGDPKSAAAMLKKGNHLVITEEFHKLKGLNVGDKLSLVSLKRGGTIDFTVAGVVWSPGLDVMATTFDLGKQFDQRTAASVFGTLEDADKLFDVRTVYLIAANLELSVPKAELIKKLQQDLGDMGLSVADVRQLKHDIVAAFSRLLLIASTIAWAAMAVASLGVTNTIMASVRSRRWQFGILRSIGVTRGMLTRLVIAEAVMLGFVSVALGFAAGMLMSVDAHRLWAIVLGYAPKFAVPWWIIGIGAGAVMLVAIVASIGPALSVAREEPLSLLQAGRAAA